MRHGNKLKTLGREASHRKAMIKNLATSILFQGLQEEQMKRQVRTTVQKAKAVRGLVDRLITYAKKGDLTSKRQAAKFVKDKDTFKGLFGVLGERYQERAGGYTRILKLSTNRHGDNASMAIISLVEDEVIKKKKKPAKKKSANVKAAKPAAEETADAVNSDAAVSAEPAKEAKTEATKAVAPAKEAKVEEPKAEAKKAPDKKAEAKPEAKAEDKKKEK